MNSAWRSRCRTCDDASDGRRPSFPHTYSSTRGSTFEYVPTTPLIFPTEITSRARSSRSRSRSSSNAHSASLCPNVVGSACTPCVRPIITVSRCSKARCRVTVRSRSTLSSRMPAASRSCSARAVSSRSDEVIPKWTHRPASPIDSATACTNAATSCCVVRSISSTRSTVNDARSRMASRSPAGIRPSSAHASHASTSICSQYESLCSSVHTADISGSE